MRGALPPGKQETKPIRLRNTQETASVLQSRYILYDSPEGFIISETGKRFPKMFRHAPVFTICFPHFPEKWDPEPFIRKTVFHDSDSGSGSAGN